MSENWWYQASCAVIPVDRSVVVNAELPTMAGNPSQGRDCPLRLHLVQDDTKSGSLLWFGLRDDSRFP
jgi:hypothetical protein